MMQTEEEDEIEEEIENTEWVWLLLSSWLISESDILVRSIKLLLLLLLSIPVNQSITWTDMESLPKRPENLTVVEDIELEVEVDMSSWSWSIESLLTIVKCNQNRQHIVLASRIAFQRITFLELWQNNKGIAFLFYTEK